MTPTNASAGSTRQHRFDMPEMQSCIAACLDCFKECEYCGAQCIGMAEMAACAKACLDCATTCQTCVTLVARESPVHGQSCGLCAEACRRCADECEKHDAEHCKRCAQACRRCAEECGRMAQMMAA